MALQRVFGLLGCLVILGGDVDGDARLGPEHRIRTVVEVAELVACKFVWVGFEEQLIARVAGPGCVDQFDHGGKPHVSRVWFL